MAASGRTVPSLIDVANSGIPRSRRHAGEFAGVPRADPIQGRGPEHLHLAGDEDAAEPLLEQALYGGISAEQVAQQIMDATAALFARAER